MAPNDKENGLFPYEVRDVDPDLNSEITEDYSGLHPRHVQVGPQKWFLGKEYAKETENLYNFKFRKDDVVVATFPRSGTTLTQEIVWLLCNNLDYEEARKETLLDRFPFLEFNVFFYDYFTPDHIKAYFTDGKTVRERLVDTQGPRFIKTHLSFSLLPPNLTKIGCKIIYIARNPKDVAVSYYHFHRSILLIGYKGNFPKFWDLFERDLKGCAPFWEHLKEGWSRRNEENVLFLFYEDMIKDLRSAIEKIAGFLGKSYTNEEFITLENHLQIDNFRNNRSVNLKHRENLISETEEGFIRNGETGGWKDYFDEELEKRADEWIEKNLKDTDFRFPL